MANPLFIPYQANFEGLPGYIAGLPGYPRNFTRDVILAGLLAKDQDLLATQLEISAAHQGTVLDPLTGEEPGKIHHEWPGVSLPGGATLLTTYNACDTTSLFLIGIELLGQLQPARQAQFLSQHPGVVPAALAYLRAHLVQNVFYEFHPLAERYALQVTYWKDSIAPDLAGKTQLAYPVSYALAHFQAARALLSGAALTREPAWLDQADQMYRVGIALFLLPGSFRIAVGQDFELDQVSSDELHILAYIPAVYRDLLPLPAIQQRASALISPVGFACRPQTIHLENEYHGYVVWPFEQAFIHVGCENFALPQEALVAKRVVPYIKAGNELIELRPSIRPGGNPLQLWSVAAAQYFSVQNHRSNPPPGTLLFP